MVRRGIVFSSTNNYLLILNTLICLATTQTQQYDEVMPSASNSQKIIKDQPIIIHTIAQNYDQPTLGEYQLCHENRNSCLEVCESASNQMACEAECPTCPILIDQNIVVQGINDTDYRAPTITASGNTTNIIRLTNEIHNIIDNKLGNITAHNENNIHVHQNVSTIGGKFGLGYNQNGSCCIVVRTSRNCTRQRFATAERCHHKRQRVCGERCVARVMYAKRTIKCDDAQEGEDQKCRESITYVPHNQRRHADKQARCQYTQQWPFVECGSHMSNCQRCYQLPYINVMQQRIPRSCQHCYGSIGGGMTGYMLPPPYYGAAWPVLPVMPYYAAPMYPAVGSHHADGFNGDNELLPPGNGWQLESTKCTAGDGWCRNEWNAAGSGDGAISNGVDVGDVINDKNDNVDDFDNYDYEDELGGVEAVRRRRQLARGFRRSSYSRRHRRNHGS